MGEGDLAMLTSSRLRGRSWSYKLTFFPAERVPQASFVHQGRSCGSTAASTTGKFRDKLQALIERYRFSLVLSDDWIWDMHSTGLGSRYANTTGPGPKTQGYIEL